MHLAAILIVADKAAAVSEVRHALERQGYTILAVTTSREEAVQSATESSPDLVLIDLDMTGELDGIDVAERLRPCCAAPILFLEAAEEKTTLRRSGISAPFDLIQKPVREHELHTFLQMALYRHRLESRLRASEARTRAVEQDLRQRDHALRLLNQANQALGATLDQGQVLATFLEQVGQLLGVQALSVWLIDRHTGALVCEQAIGIQAEIVQGWHLAPGEGIAGRVAASGKSLLVSDTRTDARHFKGVDRQTGLEIRSVLSVPLRVKGETIGALQIVDEQPARFQATDLVLLESLAATAAIAIEHARLLVQARHDAETKTRLLREVNHRVKNNLSALIGILYAEQQHARLQDQVVYRSVMQSIMNRVRGLAAVHSLLSSSEWAPVELSQLIAQVGRSALQALPPDKSVSIEVSPITPHVTPDQAHYLALIVNELVTNTVKHAMSGRAQARITIHTQQEDKMVTLEFRDDGPGYPPGVVELQQHNVGFDLIQSLVHDGLRGELALFNEAGAVARVRFKSDLETNKA